MKNRCSFPRILALATVLWGFAATTPAQVRDLKTDGAGKPLSGTPLNLGGENVTGTLDLARLPISQSASGVAAGKAAAEQVRL